MKCLILILFILVPITGSSATYYVATDGSGDYTTIAQINSATFSPGDSILFRRGDTWREPQLTIPSSGTAENYITFGAYGTGDKPRFLGSEIETTWTNVSGNTWKSANTFTDPDSIGYDRGGLYFVETDESVSWGRVKKTTTGDLVQEYDWTWDADHIYIYSPTDPNTRYSGVEITQQKQGIYLHDKAYITIDGLEIAYYEYGGIIEQYPSSDLSGLTIKNCLIHHMGVKDGDAAYGIQATYRDMLIQNNEIHNCGRRAVSLVVYDGSSADVNNVIIEDNTMYDSFHTTGVDINNVGTGTFNNIYIRNNYFYHNPLEGAIDNVETYGSIFIFCTNSSTGTIENIYVHNNIFQNNIGIAISLGVEDGPTAFRVYNNTFYGVDPNVTDNKSFMQAQAGSNITMKNNIVYNNTTSSSFNIFLVLSDAGTVTLDYNLYYNTTATRAISWRGTSYTVSEWETYKSETGQDANSISQQDPLFLSSTDYHLQENSPAIDAGVDVGLTTDYEGNSINGTPDIGAYEF